MIILGTCRTHNQLSLLSIPWKYLAYVTMLKIICFTSTVLVSLSCVHAFTSLHSKHKKHDFTLEAVKKKASEKGKLHKYFPCIDIGDIPDPGSSVSTMANGIPICIAVDRTGGVFALEDKCAIHTLSSGAIHDDGFIEDKFYGTKFSLDTGVVLDGEWCRSRIGRLLGRNHKPRNVKVYPIRHKGRHLELQMIVDPSNIDQH